MNEAAKEALKVMWLENERRKIVKADIFWKLVTKSEKVDKRPKQE